MNHLYYSGPVVLAILDGVGLSTSDYGNALHQAKLPFLNHCFAHESFLSLRASGPDVGLLEGYMGNSEVGHNTIGTGQIIKHGIAHIEEHFATGQIWQSAAWRDAIKNLHAHRSTLHFAGIFSDGGVHSHIGHLEKMIQKAYEEGVRKIRLHLVLDGRDVAPVSEPRFIQRIEQFFQHFPDADFRIASGGGRMVFVADRYQSDWSIVEAGWQAMVAGKATCYFHDAVTAIQSLRVQIPGLQDQNCPPFVIVSEDSTPVGRIQDHDSVIYYDFRADRALEISMTFTQEDFPYFDRGQRPEVYFAGLTEYQADDHAPQNQLVPPINLSAPLNVFLGQQGISQFAISESVKFGHITYYFNGNSAEKAPLEDHFEVPSDQGITFDTTPAMKSAGITDQVLANLSKYRFIRINYPGGDMVGHTGNLAATVQALEAIDAQLARLAQAVEQLGGVLIITADHGNAEAMLDQNGAPKTSHTTNPVPCIFYDHTPNAQLYRLASGHLGLSNLASTIALLLDQPNYPAAWATPLIELL